jgi:RNA polymerase sigma factor (sigma-70 family)
MTLEEAARQAIAGDKDVLNLLVTAMQCDIFGFALRMLCNRQDAEDATQEILIRIVTRLSQFDFRSKLKTWAYRVAVNYILDVKKSAVERLQMSFEQLAEDITGGLSQIAPPEARRALAKALHEGRRRGWNVRRPWVREHAIVGGGWSRSRPWIPQELSTPHLGWLGSVGVGWK